MPKISATLTTVLAGLAVVIAGATATNSDLEITSDHCNMALELLKCFGDQTFCMEGVDRSKTALLSYSGYRDFEPCCADWPDRSKLFTITASFGDVAHATRRGIRSVAFKNRLYQGFCGDEEHEYLNRVEAGPYDWGKTVHLEFDNSEEETGIIRFFIQSGSIARDLGSYPGCEYHGEMTVGESGMYVRKFDRAVHYLGFP